MCVHYVSVCVRLSACHGTHMEVREKPWNQFSLLTFVCFRRRNWVAWLERQTPLLGEARRLPFLCFTALVVKRFAPMASVGIYITQRRSWRPAGVS